MAKITLTINFNKDEMEVDKLQGLEGTLEDLRLSLKNDGLDVDLQIEEDEICNHRGVFRGEVCPKCNSYVDLPFTRMEPEDFLGLPEFKETPKEVLKAVDEIANSSVGFKMIMDKKNKE